MKNLDLSKISKKSPLNAKQCIKLIRESMIQQITSGTGFLSSNEIQSLGDGPNVNKENFNTLIKQSEQVIFCFQKAQELHNEITTQFRVLERILSAYLQHTNCLHVYFSGEPLPQIFKRLWLKVVGLIVVDKEFDSLEELSSISINLHEKEITGLLKNIKELQEKFYNEKNIIYGLSQDIGNEHFLTLAGDLQEDIENKVGIVEDMLVALDGVFSYLVKCDNNQYNGFLSHQ